MEDDIHSSAANVGGPFAVWQAANLPRSEKPPAVVFQPRPSRPASRDGHPADVDALMPNECHPPTFYDPAAFFCRIKVNYITAPTNKAFDFGLVANAQELIPDLKRLKARKGLHPDIYKQIDYALEKIAESSSGNRG